MKQGETNGTEEQSRSERPMTAAPVLSSNGSSVLRYLFDEGARVELHFQRVDGRTLFFCSPRIRERPGETLNVQFGLNGRSETLPFRAKVYAHEMGGSFDGTWLEFALRDMGAALEKAVLAPRAHERVAVNLAVQIVRGDGSKFLCRISEMSERGARLCGAPGSLDSGEGVSISLLGAPAHKSFLASGRVIWREKESGVEFTHGPTPRALTELLERAREAQRTALEIRHPQNCRCQAGDIPLQPAVPRTAFRRET
jgi:hypothetical protein